MYFLPIFISPYLFDPSASVLTMKASATILALASVASAHYNFPSLLVGGKTTAAWGAVRQWTGYYTYNPVTDVTKTDIRCNVGGTTIFANNTQAITAGSTVGFTADPDIYHPGPLLVYMAKVPAGKTAANWDGSGAVWFKIFSQGPIFGAQLSWPTDSESSIVLVSCKTNKSERRKASVLQDPSCNPKRRLSSQSRAHRTAHCFRRRRCAVLYLLWPSHRHGWWKWEAWSLGGFPWCLFSYRSWNQVEHLLACGTLTSQDVLEVITDFR